MDNFQKIGLGFSEGLAAPLIEVVLAIFISMMFTVTTTIQEVSKTLPGHGTVEELDVLIPKAFETGVQKVFINHPHFIINAPFDAVKRWVEMGAVVEINAVMFEGVSPASAGGQGLPLEIALEYINHLPVDKIVIDTDLGQKGGTMPVEGMYRFLSMLIQAGVSYDKIEYMTKITPAKLLGLEI
jgi:hypothetical protein